MRSDLVAMALTALCVVGIVILSMLGVAIPEVLTTVTLVSIGVGGGLGVGGANARREPEAPAATAAPSATTSGTGLL